MAVECTDGGLICSNMDAVGGGHSQEEKGELVPVDDPCSPWNGRPMAIPGCHKGEETTPFELSSEDSILLAEVSIIRFIPATDVSSYGFIPATDVGECNWALGCLSYSC